MATIERPTTEMQGMYRDVLRDAGGRVVWDRGWCRNAIVLDCHRLLAGLLGGPVASLGIQGLRVGQGLDAWDVAGPPPATPAQKALVDPHPFLVPAAPPSLKIDFLEGGTVTGNATNRLQIVATLGPNVPPWPDANHASGNLREFGLVGKLGGNEVLINYVTHPVIVKDPASTLTRTVWLVL
ncbi:MAG TPA: hypothetical protein VF591_25955 [Pyrinomonadaceae bacterium]|jgi:hypothetical protein